MVKSWRQWASSPRGFKWVRTIPGTSNCMTANLHRHVRYDGPGCVTTDLIPKVQDPTQRSWPSVPQIALTQHPGSKLIKALHRTQTTQACVYWCLQMPDAQHKASYVFWKFLEGLKGGEQWRGFAWVTWAIEHNHLLGSHCAYYSNSIINNSFQNSLKWAPNKMRREWGL